MPTKWPNFAQRPAKEDSAKSRSSNPLRFQHKSFQRARVKVEKGSAIQKENAEPCGPAFSSPQIKTYGLNRKNIVLVPPVLFVNGGVAPGASAKGANRFVVDWMPSVGSDQSTTTFGPDG